MTKKLELLSWMKQRKVFATHEILQYGVNNFFNRADRTKRDLMEEGLIRKLPDWEKKNKGYTCKDAVYEIIERSIEDYVQPKLF